MFDARELGRQVGFIHEQEKQAFLGKAIGAGKAIGSGISKAVGAGKAIGSGISKGVSSFNKANKGLGRDLKSEGSKVVRGAGDLVKGVGQATTGGDLIPAVLNMRKGVKGIAGGTAGFIAKRPVVSAGTVMAINSAPNPWSKEKKIWE